MFDITLTTDAAIILRDALRVYKERWPGGDPEEQENIMFLEMQFIKMVLESTIDAWSLSMERGLGTLEKIMSQVELRQRVREQSNARKEQVLKYRGVSYIQKSIDVDGIQIRSGRESCWPSRRPGC